MAVLDPSTMYGSAAVKASSVTAATPEVLPKANSDILPVIPLSTAAANTLRHVHPVLLLSLLLFRFKALVEGPTSEMTKALPVVAVIQVAYVLVCLPATGSNQATKKKPKLGEKKKKEEKDVSGVLTAIFSLLLTVITILPIHIGFILFGAPADSLVIETGLVSALTALLALFPVFYTRGVTPESWVALAGLKTPIDEVTGGFVGCLVGAWLGAIPIPLDWDRAWQRWPITIIVGMWLGGIIGRSTGGYLVKKPSISS